MARTGKIARLPRHIRTLLNRRLQDGEPGRELIQWLNALPEVQTLLQRDFAGREITDSNLSDWKQHGFREWEFRQEALDRAADLSDDAGELAHTARGPLADHLASLLTARYASEFAAWTGEDTDESRPRLRALRRLCHDVVELQRGAQNAVRVQIEQARLDRRREKTEEELIEVFLRWLAYPKVLACICDPAAALDDRNERLRELFRAIASQPKAPLISSDPLFPDPACDANLPQDPVASISNLPLET